MMTKLLRYLSFFALIAILVSCEDDDKITDNLPPEDANLFAFKPLEFNQTVDQNGNTFFASGVLKVDADVSSEAEQGYSKQVLIQITKWIDGEEIEITKGAPFNLSGNGAGDAKTFNLDFSDIIDEKSAVNIAANLLEAGSQRKIKAVGILINAETAAEDSRVDYKIKTIVWSDSIDRNGDAFYASRSVDFVVATEGDVEKTLNGNIFLINDTDKDTTNIFQTGQFTVRREGFSDAEISFSINTGNNLIRSGYEILMRFNEVGNPEIVYEELFKAADLVRIGFEPTLYDNRQYSVPNAPNLVVANQDTLGYADSVVINFQIAANSDLEYYDLDNTGKEFDLRAPYVRIQYWRIYDPEYSDYLNLGDSALGADPVNPQNVGFFISDLVRGDSATYDFRIQIMEPSRNFFNSNDDVVVAEYDKNDFPVLGGVKIDP